MLPSTKHSLRWVLALFLLVGFPAALRLLDRGTPPRLPRPVNPEICRLIDQLTEVSEEGIGFHSTAWAGGFIAIDQEPRFRGGVLGSHRPVVAHALRELVRRGVEALPDLLNHLTDPRETKLAVRNFGGGGFGAAWFGDEYEPRHSDHDRHPAGVNRRGAFGRAHVAMPYRMRVGDLCFVAVGQIVNRHFNALRYQPTACLVINSPVQTPELAAAVRTDWGGLTAEEHKRSLAMDALKPDYPWAVGAALVRLCFYYPADGEELAARLLAKPGDVPTHARVIEALGAVRNGSVDRLVEQAAAADAQAPLSEQGHTELITALAPFRSEAVDEAVRRMFLAADLKRYKGFEQIYTDDFVLACVDRLAGKGLDRQFAAYCRGRVAELSQGQRQFAETQRLQLLRAALGRLEVRRAEK
jgi:hypothetical protein